MRQEHDDASPIPRRRHPPLSLRDLKQGWYHTLSDARRLLIPPADRRSLNSWIEDLGITVYKSPVKGHSYLIAHKDLVTIASLIGRGLKEEGRASRHPYPRDDSAQHETELEIQQAREIAALRAQIDVLKERQRQEIAMLQQKHTQDMEQLRQALLGEQTRAIPDASEENMREVSPITYVPPHLVKPHTIPADLPEGTIFMRWFLEPHGTTRDVMTAAAKRGDIRAIARSYEREGQQGKGTRKQRIQYFLDPHMQDEAVAWLVKRGYGHRCPYCPHAKQH